MAVMGVWAFILCTRHRRHIKQKNQKPWKHTKQVFPEQKTKTSFVLHHLWPVHEVLTGIWNPLISGQIVNSFGQGKCTFDCESGNLINYASGKHVLTSSCVLRIEKLITFNMTCMWTVSYKFTLAWLGICFSCMYTNNYEHFHNDLLLFTGIIQC